jgi:hypothetical protein
MGDIIDQDYLIGLAKYASVWMGNYIHRILKFDEVDMNSSIVSAFENISETWSGAEAGYYDIEDIIQDLGHYINGIFDDIRDYEIETMESDDAAEEIVAKYNARRMVNDSELNDILDI